MLDYIVPEDNETNDSAVHKQIRERIKEPADTEDDKPFSREETASVIKKKNKSLILERLLGRMDWQVTYCYVFQKLSILSNWGVQ